MAYVRLKHALSAAVLAAVDDSREAPTVEALAACAASDRGASAPVDDLARAAGLTPEEVRRRLLATGVCVEAGGARLVGLDPIFASHAAYAARQTARAADAVRVLRGPAPQGLSAVVWRAVVLFNAGLFFECHEYLERPWRAADRGDRAFYHGLIQAAAGCYHFEKGNVHGTDALLAKAIVNLRPYAPAAHGIDVAGLLDGLADVRAGALAVPPRLPHGRLPVIRLAADPGAVSSGIG